MDSQHSEIPCHLNHLRHAVWHGDWDDALRLSRGPVAEGRTSNVIELNARMVALQEILASAKAARAEMITSLGRLRAAAGFNLSGTDRQVFADPPVF